MQYRDLATYEHKDIKFYNVRHLASLYNRSEAQVLWLYNLCQGDIYRYHELELNINKYNIRYCPETIYEINKINKNVE